MAFDRLRFGLLAPGLLALCLASPARALTLDTFQACATPGAPLGQADKIDGTGGNAIGAGSGAPYNLDHADDAIVCVDRHTRSGSVDTAAEFENEIANSASHELGHLLGLEHADGATNSIMNGSYTGVDLGFTTTAEKAVMNAQPNQVQIVFLDFGLTSSEIPNPSTYAGGFAAASVLSSFGITGAAAIQAAIDAIVSNITADFAGPWTSGTTYEFYTVEGEALEAALANVTSDYSTVLFAPVPEPGTGLLLFAGVGGLVRLRRRTPH